MRHKDMWYMQSQKNNCKIERKIKMKVLINLLKFIFITILTICLIALGAITIASSTVLNKNYVMQKLEETDFQSGTYKLVESNFEKYIYQSGLDEEVLKSICTEDKVKNDIDLMLSNIYDGTNKTIDTTEISTNLNQNIDKLGIKTKSPIIPKIACIIRNI